MNEAQAAAVAAALGGEAWHSGGNIWLVRFRRQDGKITAISDDLVGEYPDEDAFHRGEATAMIPIGA